MKTKILRGKDMKIVKERYCIASKSFPLTFQGGEGYECDDIEEAMLFFTKKDCEYELDIFDEPENFQILKVEVTYEF